MDHILVVDDDPNIRDLLRDYLQSMGFGVFAATGSAQMKQIIGTSRIDMVVLDLTLDGEDGIDVARDLRRRNTVPIVMLSARGALLDRIIGLEMGPDDYLPKPFDPRELLAKIRSVLRRTRSAPCKEHRHGAWRNARVAQPFNTRTRRRFNFAARLKSPAPLPVSARENA